MAIVEAEPDTETQTTDSKANISEVAPSNAQYQSGRRLQQITRDRRWDHRRAIEQSPPAY